MHRHRVTPSAGYPANRLFYPLFHLFYEWDSARGTVSFRPAHRRKREVKKNSGWRAGKRSQVKKIEARKEQSKKVKKSQVAEVVK
jgi:hypothetical protein